MKKFVAFILAIILALSSVPAFAESNETDCTHNFWRLNCNSEKDYCLKCGAPATLFSEQKCNTCNGTGRVKCSDCNGKGTEFMECFLCDGKGTMGALSHGDYSVELRCAICDGKGGSIVECFSCDGTGKTKCRASGCENGKKTVPSSVCVKCNSDPVCCEFCFYHQKSCPICENEEYHGFIYNEIVREPKSYISQQYYFSGTVTSISTNSAGTEYDIRMKNVEGDITRYYSITYIPLKNVSPTLLSGDKVTFYGVFDGVNNSMEPNMVAVYATIE